MKKTLIAVNEPLIDHKLTCIGIAFRKRKNRINEFKFRAFRICGNGCHFVTEISQIFSNLSK